MENVQELEIEQAIRLRRTVKPDRMNGRRIDDKVITGLLQLADWAPTHANTEPWRFIVFSNDAVKRFTKRHADLYRENTAEPTFTPQKYNNLERLGENTSHIVIVWMKRVPNHKIPEIEEIAATAAAVQNILLAATARGMASFWSTGGMALHPSLRDELKLGAEDKVLAILYLGYTDDAPKNGNRIIPLADKTEWIQ